MKKIIILILVLLFVISGFGFADSKKEEESKKPPSIFDAVTKSYVLKHVSPKTIHNTLRQYFWESSYDRNGKMLTVKIAKENISKFEELLKKLDVEKKTILIRFFTVIASHEGKSAAVPNKDLQQVLLELQKVLSFKAFRLDGVSAITVKDGQRHSRLLLSSHSPLELTLEDISINGETQGQRTIGFFFILKQKTEPLILKDGQRVYETLISTETSVKEKGYLVAGVSKIGNGDSLVLVINAEIK
jgi:uncharacterized protein YxeA